MPGTIIDYQDIYKKIGTIHIIKITTKFMMLIRPKLPNDAYTQQFSFPASEQVKNYAVSRGWSVTDLQADDATTAKINDTLDHQIVDFVAHLDHGSDYTMWGQQNGASVPAIDTSNANKLKNRAVNTVSCLTASGLGPYAIAQGSKAYLGYADLHWVNLGWISQFIEASNAASYALLDGKTYQEAYQAAYDKYTQKYQELVNNGDTVSASLLLGDRDILTLLGDPNARATGSHYLFELVYPIPKEKPVPYVS